MLPNHECLLNASIIKWNRICSILRNREDYTKAIEMMSRGDPICSMRNSCPTCPCGTDSGPCTEIDRARLLGAPKEEVLGLATQMLSHMERRGMRDRFRATVATDEDCAQCPGKKESICPGNSMLITQYRFVDLDYGVGVQR